MPLGKQFADDFVFEFAQFAVGDDEEVAAATGGVEKVQTAYFFVQRIYGLAAFAFGLAAGCLKTGAQAVHKQAVNHFEDIGFFGVVCAQFAPLYTVHHALEQAAEDFGADFRPVAAAAFKQQFAQFGVEVKLT